MNNKGSCLTFNSLINLFPKVKDVLHCDFLICHLHTLDFFFPFCFSQETILLSFSLNKLSTHLDSGASQCLVGLRGWGSGLENWGRVTDLPPLFNFRGEAMWENREEKRKHCHFLTNAVFCCCRQTKTQVLSPVSLQAQRIIKGPLCVVTPVVWCNYLHRCCC